MNRLARNEIQMSSFRIWTWIANFIHYNDHYIKNNVYIYLTPPDEQGAILVWIQSFPSPRPVAIPRLKSPVCSTVYPYLCQEYYCFVKCKQSRSGFELGLPCSLPVTITITLNEPDIVENPDTPWEWIIQSIKDASKVVTKGWVR